MSEGVKLDSAPRPIAGLRLGTAEAAIKKPGRHDLLLIELGQYTTSAAVFTRNAFCAAPVSVARQHLQHHTPRYLLINSGNANAGTGRQGEADAVRSCQAVAQLTGCEAEAVLPFSTGVIGEPLPIERMEGALPAARDNLSESGWPAAARAIMTTDTVEKVCSTSLDIGAERVNITGIAKGSGMIRPDMATMLSYIGTDAAVAAPQLQVMLQRAVDRSFNRISVDGDTSTNDACVLMATGESGVAVVSEADQARFQQALNAVCEDLAKAIVRDGEGATKLIEVQVEQGASEAECLQVAYTVAHSPLVKTAFFASDPNWGRILAAVGRAGIAELDIDGVVIYLDEVCIVEEGGRSPSYTEEQGQRVMNQDAITITVRLGRGTAQGRVWTCDFSYDYVRINAEYRT